MNLAWSTSGRIVAMPYPAASAAGGNARCCASIQHSFCSTNRFPGSTLSRSRPAEIISSLRASGIGVLITDHNVRETLSVTDRHTSSTTAEFSARASPNSWLAIRKSAACIWGKLFAGVRKTSLAVSRWSLAKQKACGNDEWRKTNDKRPTTNVRNDKKP